MERRVYACGQMSGAVSTGTSLTSFGGFRNACTYYYGDGVSANTQTGNIVPTGSHLASREWGMAFRYIAPVAASACDVYMAEHIRRQRKCNRQFHWRQMVMATEIILLFLVGFMPQSMNMAADIAISFVYVTQISAFRKIKGSPYATTMCTGNLCSGTEHFHTYRHTKGPENRNQRVRYYRVIVISPVGAILGAVLTARLAEKAIWVSCSLFLISFLTMFLQGDMGERKRIR